MILRDYLMFLLLGICTASMVFAAITDFKSVRMKRSLFYLALSVMLQMICDKLVSLYLGDTSEFGVFMTHTCKFSIYAFYLLIVFIFNQYIRDLLLTEGELEKTPKLLEYAEYIICLGFMTLLGSQVTGWLYYFDENNQYHRAGGYLLAYVYPMLAIVVQIVAIIKYRQKIRKIMLFPLIAFALFPLFGAVFQYYIHGVSAVSVFVVSMVVLLYSFSIMDTNQTIRESYQKELDLLTEAQETKELMISQTTMALVEAIDAKDSYTNGHSRRVAEYSEKIAELAGKSKEECKKIYMIALLHDVGKIGIPDAIITKPGRLTDEEFAIIKSHPRIGREILTKISISPDLATGASFHHERYDGKGYPFGIKGEEIPEIARIIAVADSYDAMASKRSYRDVLPVEKIRSELEKGKGTQFDPKFAEIMIGIIDSNRTLKEHLA